MAFDFNLDPLSDAIRDLSKRLQELRGADDGDSDRLREYKENDAQLEFTLVTGGLIRGRLLWISNRSLGVRSESGRDFILYKHAIAFIQECVD